MVRCPAAAEDIWQASSLQGLLQRGPSVAEGEGDPPLRSEHFENARLSGTRSETTDGCRFRSRGFRKADGAGESGERT